MEFPAEFEKSAGCTFGPSRRPDFFLARLDQLRLKFLFIRPAVKGKFIFTLELRVGRIALCDSDYSRHFRYLRELRALVSPFTRQSRSYDEC